MDENELYTDVDAVDLENVDCDRELFLQKSPNIKDTMPSSNADQYSLAASLAAKKDRAVSSETTGTMAHFSVVSGGTDEQSDFYPRLTSGVLNISVDYASRRKGGLVEGTFWKQCPTFPLLWQTRFFILKPDGSIYYYYNKMDYLRGIASRGVISMSDVNTRLPGDGVVALNKQLRITVHSKWGRTYVLELNSIGSIFYICSNSLLHWPL